MSIAIRDLTATVRATIHRRALLDRGDRVVVAVSGGPDSVALLDVLDGFRDELGLELCVAHLNHRLRPSAAEDAAFVQTRAAARGLPCRVAERDVAADRRVRGGSVEMAARRVRYAFLEEVANSVCADKVATGHTADDQVETVLLRLLRGGGLDALGGMPPSRPIRRGSSIRVVRPLIDASRRQILDHLACHRLAYREDETNRDTAFARNALRHQLLPALDRAHGGAFRATVLAAADQARELTARLDQAAAGLLNIGGNGVRVALAPLRGLSRLHLARVVRQGFAAVGGEGPVSEEAVRGVSALLRGGSGRQVMLPDSVVVLREHDALLFQRGGESRARPLPAQGQAERHRLPVPGSVEVPEADVQVEAQRIVERPQHLPCDDPRDEVIDLERAGEPLVVRRREAGDRFAPLGLNGTKKLKDFFTDEHVPQAARNRALVVEGPGGIVWVVGHRLDDRAKVTPRTRQFARLTARPLEPHSRRVT
jgi:tRNA(Ile)-lysidine synthase